MFLYEGECPNCKQTKNMTSVSKYCGDCTKAIEEAKFDSYMEEKKKLTVEERLELIEKFIYKHQQNHPTQEVYYR